MTPIYRFYLQRVGDSTERVIANPIYKNDLSVKYQKESGEQFFRKSLEGKLTFVRYDYDYIMATPFDTIIRFSIEKSNDNGNTYEPYYVGKFLRTDCTIDEDNRNISVQPEYEDEYTEILAGIENEYNLLSLAPPIDRFVQYVRPVIQFYIEGTDKVQNYIGGMYYESDATPTTGEDIVRTYHFALHYIDEVVITLTSVLAGDTRANGTYRGRLTIGQTTHTGTLRPDVSNGYEIRYTLNQDGVTGSIEVWDIVENLLRGTTDLTASQIKLEYNIGGEYSATMYNISKEPYVRIYTRFLLNVPEYRGVPTYPIPSEDIVEDNKNYLYCIGFGGTSGIRSSRNEVSFPTNWGLKPNGKYYQVPDNLYVYYPLARSLWGDKAYWFFEFEGYEYMEESGRSTKIMPDTYTLENVINVLLREITNGKINFFNNYQCSEYMFGSARGVGFWHLFVTPNSNVLEGDYTTPAQKGPITLRSILDMLKKAYGMYWHIEGNLLRIEHIRYYKNGGSYTSTPVIGTDLTALKNTRNGKELAFDTSNYTFNKSAMTARYEYEWANEVSEPFKGQAMIVKANYVQKDKVEKINIADFTTDLDYMNINPGAINKDGFTLFETRWIDNAWRVPIVTINAGRNRYTLNNGYLAMYYLQPNHLTYDMPAESIEVNGEDSWAQGLMRGKEQTINFPCGENDPNPLQLIKTNMGAGQVKTIQINLTSRNAKTTLMYETR